MILRIKNGKAVWNFAYLNILRFSMTAAILGFLVGCFENDNSTIKIRPNLEEIKSDNTIFTPATLSILRKNHWLEDVSSMRLDIKDTTGEFYLTDDNKEHFLEFSNIPLDQLVPRLYYKPKSPPDEFDRINLMLAEFTRNGISVPYGQKDDKFSHFKTSLSEQTPWSLKEDYQFLPNRDFRPLRMTISNNCLVPGLWELSGTDGTGEIYHSWFNFPKDTYYNLVAQVNSLDKGFVKDALDWSTDTVPLDLSRLRTETGHFGAFPLKLKDGKIGYSSQSSRKKLQNGFVRIKNDGIVGLPSQRSDLIKNPLIMPGFVKPGIYSMESHKEFELDYLGEPTTVNIRSVKPKTLLPDVKIDDIDQKDVLHLEFELALGNKKIIVGNLPASILVKQEEFGIHGLGVGVLKAEDFSERRNILLTEGYFPSYAYLVLDKNNHVVNSHDYGIEQIFVRAVLDSGNPHWEITLTSFERIVDLAKYEIPIPKSILSDVVKFSEDYLAPAYFSYRDDNIR